MSGSRIIGTKWALTSIVLEGATIERVVEAEADLTLEADGRVYGRGGCNRYFGPYTMEGTSIRFGPLASTLMYCEETMEVEQAFLKALETVGEFLVAAEMMSMKNDDGSTVLTFRRGPEVEPPAARAVQIMS